MFLKRHLIGLDIGSDYIKVAQINDTKAGYELALFNMLPLQQGVVGDGVILDKNKLVSFIRELLKKAGIKSGDAVIGVSGQSSVIVKKITVPLMIEDELALSIKYEAEQHIPFDINNVNIDFEILGPSAEAEGQMDVILVAVKKNVVNDYREVVESVGLNPAIVDVSSFALSNMFEINYGTADKSNIALINIGASTSNINILYNGLPIFVRDTAIGSNHLTEALEISLDINRENAEKLKMGRSVEGISPDDVQAVINSASDEVFAEIYRSFEFFKGVASEKEIDRIVLSGGAALINAFPDMMTERFGIQVEVANPFKRVIIPDKFDIAHIRDVAPMAAVAVGLGVRRVGDR